MRAKLRAALKASAKHAPVLMRDAAGLAGALMVIRGSAMVYAPAGWLVAGLGLLAWVILTARTAKA
jgi:hypothetical protein